jgi:hypothetical protein
MKFYIFRTKIVYNKSRSGATLALVELFNSRSPLIANVIAAIQYTDEAKTRLNSYICTYIPFVQSSILAPTKWKQETLRVTGWNRNA